MKFESESLPQLQSISLELMSAEDGQKMIDDKGGRMGIGHGYASDFLVVNPQTLETDKKFQIGMNVDSSAASTIQFYRSSEDMDLKTWFKVDSSVSDGFATVKTDKGNYACVHFSHTENHNNAFGSIASSPVLLRNSAVGLYLL